MDIFEMVKTLEGKHFPNGVQAEINMATYYLRRVLDAEATQQSLAVDLACADCKLQFTSSCPSLLGKRCSYFQPSH